MAALSNKEEGFEICLVASDRPAEGLEVAANAGHRQIAEHSETRERDRIEEYARRTSERQTCKTSSSKRAARSMP